MDGDLPVELRTFILEHINSVAQLETLLLLRRSAREWTAEALARELRIDQAAASEQLTELTRRGLTERLDGPARFRYARSANVDPLVAEIQKAYEERRVRIIGLIYSTPRARVQDFADAFRIRKGDDG